MKPVPNTPALPNAGRARDVNGLNDFDTDLNRALHSLLTDLARRINASLPMDGSEPMTGDLNMNNNDIINILSLILSSPTGILRNIDNGVLQLSGGATAGTGANIELYGPTHAGQPNNAFYDANTHTFRDAAGAALVTLTARGMAFPATQIPAAGANVLDDYEEGTWTPVLSFGGLSTGITYTTQLGNYVKIGRNVLLEFEINLSSRGSATGSALLSGLPFPMIRQATGTFGFYQNMAFPAGTIGTMLGYNVNGTTCDIRYHSNTTTTTADHNAFNNTSRMVGSIIYLANA